MRIIGLNHDMFISSAALIENGRVIAAVAEERLTREKQTRRFPLEAVKYCLKKAGLTIHDIDHIANGWNPGVYFQHFNPLISSGRRYKAEYLYSIPDNLMRLHEKKNVDYVHQTLKMEGRDMSIYYLTHHCAHVANAYHMSGFSECAVMTADSQGEFESMTLSICKNGKAEKLQSAIYPQSLGNFYATLTEFLGYKPNSDEWKVMALASFADGDNEYYQILKRDVVKLLDDGTFEFNLSYFNGYMLEQPRMFTDKFVAAFGPPRPPTKDEFSEKHYKIAAAFQKMTEEITYHCLRWLKKKSGMKNLAVSGGLFMNSVMNGRLLENTGFEKLYISSCPDDSGNSVGSALYLYHQVLGQPYKPERVTHNYWGPSYTNEEIKAEIDRYGLKNFKKSDNVAKDTAKMLADGKLVGWFQGQMEFGQRALGARSILCDPRSEEMKAKVNACVKYREAYRPFAPAILEERVAEYFEVPAGDATVPFMEKVYPIKKEKRAQIPAVVHVDGTGRLQTVGAQTNERFHALVREFEALTKVPIVVNTSFNLNGEPVVCSPTDAIRTFFSCGLEILVMGDYVITK